MDNMIKISPNYSVKEWLDLDLRDTTSKDWTKGFEIFEDRMNGRFFSQIEQLQAHPDKNIKGFSGFIIISVDCLLIETIMQFYKGIKKTPPRQSVDSFHDFFQKSIIFSSFFDDRVKSDIFYSQIRCGLLHQAQTKKKSTIHIKKGEPILQWIDPSDVNEGLKIHRDKFHNEVLLIFKNYLKELRSKNNNIILNNFQKKMNFIAKQE